MTSPTTSNQPSTLLTARDVAAILFRRLRLAAGSFALALVTAMLFLFLTPRYQAHFEVLLRRGRYDPVASGQPSSVMDVSRPQITEEELNSEAELLRDEGLLKQVATAAGVIAADTPPVRRESELERAVRRLSGRLEVETLKKSNFIRVSYRDRDPARAAVVLAALSSAYIDKHANLQRPSGEVQFFDRQTHESARRLHDSEAALVDFTRARGVVSAAMERDIALQKLGDADATRRLIDQEQAEAERTIASLKDQLKAFPSRSVTVKHWTDNPLLQEKLKTHLLELQLKRTQLLTRFQPSYRLVLEVDEQIAQARSAIAAETLAPVRDETTDKDPNYEWARMELEKAEVRMEGLRARGRDAAVQEAALRATAERLQASAIDQQDLMRTAKADEDTYFLYLRKLEEARIGDALDHQKILNVAIVEPPVAPAIPEHSIPYDLAIAFGLAGVVAVGVAFTAEYFDSTVRTPIEARMLLEAPVLAWLPPMAAGNPAVVTMRKKRPEVAR